MIVKYLDTLNNQPLPHAPKFILTARYYIELLRIRRYNRSMELIFLERL